MWAHDPRSAQDMSTSRNLCSPAGDDADGNYDGDDNYDGDANCDYDQGYECWVN